MISIRVYAKPLRTPRPTCKVHGTAAVAVQDEIPVRPSTGSKGDLKPSNQPGSKVLERRASDWPLIS
jgi:hypothetical protein